MDEYYKFYLNKHEESTTSDGNSSTCTSIKTGVGESIQRKLEKLKVTVSENTRSLSMH
jgi:ActR/RegA family two-component response regulator